MNFQTLERGRSMTIGRISKRTALAGLLACAFTLAGTAQQTPAPKPAAPAPAPAAKETPEKVVMKVGPQSYTEGDLEFLISSLSPQLQHAVALQGKKPLGDQFAMMAVLSQQAEKDHLDNSESFHRQMALHRMQALAEAEYQKLAEETKVSTEEISQYYTQHSTDFDEAEVREIVIRKKAEGAKDDAPGLTSAEAHTRAEEIRKALAAGTDPKKVADQYAAENMVMLDAEPRTIKRGQLIAALDKAAFGLKDGEFSEPYENPQALAFLQVVGHKHEALKDVSSNIENTLHEQKVQAAVDDLKKKTTVWMDEDYFKAPQETPAAAEPEPKN
jgi:peptidyl-prolyl cis-trans isomerase C